MGRRGRAVIHSERSVEAETGLLTFLPKEQVAVVPHFGQKLEAIAAHHTQSRGKTEASVELLAITILGVSLSGARFALNVVGAVLIGGAVAYISLQRRR